MDQELLQSFHDKLLNLQRASLNTSHTQQNIPEEHVLDGVTLSYVTEQMKIPTERFCRLKEVTDAEFPLIIACKSNAFWQALEKHEVAENSFDFVNVRKRSSKSSKCSSNADQSSMYGSPLKLDIIADLSVFEGDTTIAVGKQVVIDFGLTRSMCRKLISLYSHLYTSFKYKTSTDILDYTPSLVALCDGDNFKSVSSMILQPLLDKQNNLLGLKITETVSEPASERSTHAKCRPQFVTSDVLCKAKYDLLTETGEQVQPNMQGFLKLELEWQKTAGKSLVLLHDPPSEANAVVKIQVVSGNSRSSAFSVFQVTSTI